MNPYCVGETPLDSATVGKKGARSAKQRVIKKFSKMRGKNINICLELYPNIFFTLAKLLLMNTY